MQHKPRRRISDEEFRALFKKGKPVRIAQIGSLLDVSRPSVSRLMKRHGTFTSINNDAAFCVLPDMCQFDEAGFCEVHGMLFFRDGTQVDALERCVTESKAGMTLPEINTIIKAKVSMQMLGLVRASRLQRRMVPGVAEYVYFSADEQRAELQLARRLEPTSPKSYPVLTDDELLAKESRDNLELLAKVLLTFLRTPGISAKSVALTMIRNGQQVCTAQVREMVDRFGLDKKKDC